MINVDEYNELLKRVVDMETELQLLKTHYEGGNAKELIESRVLELESAISGFKAELISQHGYSFGFAPVENPVVADYVSQPEPVRHEGFVVRNSAPGYGPPTVGYDPPLNYVPPKRKNVELQIGKTIMSILATVLILFSIVLFGAIVYPFIGDGAKVLLMYVLSTAFIEVGLMMRKKKHKTFFTAIAACGMAMFYLSGVISCFVFNVFGLGLLFILTYAWIVTVAWVSRDTTPIFAVLCYIGIIISTCLCLLMFDDSAIGILCYIVGVVTLYLFNRSKDYSKDFLYFIQFPICLGIMMFYYAYSPFVLSLIMALVAGVYVAQKYLYKEVTDIYKACMVLTQIVMFGCYQSYWQESSVLLTLTYVFIVELLALWSFMIYEDRLLKLGPLCCMMLFFPLLQWGSFYTDYLGFAPFIFACFIVGYILKIPVVKGIGCGYIAAYIINPPSLINAEAFYIVLFTFVAVFGLLYWLRAFGSHIDTIAFMVTACAVFTVMCTGDLYHMIYFGYWVAVVLSCIFNSRIFVQDEFMQRLGWAWNGYWMCFGTSFVLMSDDAVTTVIFLIAILVAYTVNAKWQLSSEHPFAGFELCAKAALYLFVVFAKLEIAGVVLSIGFMCLAIGCVILGFYVRRKSIRLFGLILTVLSVIKCLLVDIEYSSSIYLPVGLLIAGLACFGISYVYSVFEKKLKEEPED